jgi:hypothetical protein
MYVCVLCVASTSTYSSTSMLHCRNCRRPLLKMQYEVSYYIAISHITFTKGTVARYDAQRILLYIQFYIDCFGTVSFILATVLYNF